MLFFFTRSFHFSTPEPGNERGYEHINKDSNGNVNDPEKSKGANWMAAACLGLRIENRIISATKDIPPSRKIVSTSFAFSQAP